MFSVFWRAASCCLILRSRDVPLKLDFLNVLSCSKTASLLDFFPVRPEGQGSLCQCTPLGEGVWGRWLGAPLPGQGIEVMRKCIKNNGFSYILTWSFEKKKKKINIYIYIYIYKTNGFSYIMQLPFGNNIKT